MAGRLLGGNPLSEPMLVNCQLEPKEQTSVKFVSKLQTFSFRRMNLKISFGKRRPFRFGLNVLTQLKLESIPVSIW